MDKDKNNIERRYGRGDCKNQYTMKAHLYIARGFASNELIIFHMSIQLCISGISLVNNVRTTCHKYSVQHIDS